MAISPHQMFFLDRKRDQSPTPKPPQSDCVLHGGGKGFRFMQVLTLHILFFPKLLRSYTGMCGSGTPLLSPPIYNPWGAPDPEGGVI